MKLVYRLITCAVAALLITACNRMTPEERLEKVQEAIDQQDLLSAEMEAAKIVEKHPDDPAADVARLRLAQIYIKDGRLDEAANEFAQLLESYPPGSVEGWGALRQYYGVLKKQKRYDEALAHLDKYAGRVTTSPQAGIEVKVARVDLKTAAAQTTEARAILDDLMDDTTDTMAHRTFREFYVQTYAADRDTTGAITYLEAQLPQIPAELKKDTLFQLSGMYASLGNYEQLRKWVQEVTNLTGEEVKNQLDRNAQIQDLFTLGQFYEGVGNLQGARIIFERLFEVNTDPAFGPFIVPVLYRTLMREGKTEEGIKFLHQATARYKDPKLAEEVAMVEAQLKAQPGKVDTRETAPLTLQFAADPVLPINLDVLVSQTTGSLAAGTVANTDVATTPSSSADTTGSAITSSDTATTN